MEVQRVLLKPEEAAAALGIGRTKVFELIGSGTLASFRIGSSRRIPLQAITDFVACGGKLPSAVVGIAAERPEPPTPAPQRPPAAEAGAGGGPTKHRRARRKPDDKRPADGGAVQPPLFHPTPMAQESDS